MKQQPVIKFEHVFIDYRQNPAGVYSIKDAITSWSHPFRKKTILKDITFEIMPGEHLGIAGRNGSGKSTLLRAIAGIIKPSKGRIQVNGKIAPILALGAGLELEMTGYENIRLLLSLNGHQVNHQIVNQIQHFSELDEQTLNQAVKSYSTGMLARLAFSISFAHESDIYIIDEILAVGDLGFQQKCIEKIHDIQQKGHTIIFVSHFPAEMVNLCNQALLLEQGEIIDRGSAKQVAEKYKELFELNHD